MNPIAQISKNSEENLNDKFIEQDLKAIVDEFNLETINLMKQPTLALSLEKLYKCGMLDLKMYNASKFVSENRNNFVQNYFMNKPLVFKNQSSMKQLTLQIVYTKHAICQILSFVTNEFITTFLEKDTIVSLFGNELEKKIFNQLK